MRISIDISSGTLDAKELAGDFINFGVNFVVHNFPKSVVLFVSDDDVLNLHRARSILECKNIHYVD